MSETLPLCECGCGKRVTKAGNRFIHGHNRRGKHHTEETKEKIGKIHKGKKVSEETKKKMSEASKRENLSEETLKKMSKAQSGENNSFYGKHHTEETKKKLSKANSGKNNPMYGKHFSEEHRKKLSKAQSGENNSFYGKHHTEETKKKMSEASKRENLSEETLKKMREAQSGRELPEEFRKEMKSQSGENNPMYGRHHSEETRKKISESLKGRKPAEGIGIGKGSYSDKGHWVRSSWERTVADWFYENNVKYEYEPKRFQFNKEKKFSYLPDFHLIDYDLWVEVKGWMKPKNKIQHHLFRSQGYDLIIIDDMDKFPNQLDEIIDI